MTGTDRPVEKRLIYRVKMLRKIRGWSVKELAGKADLHPVTVSKIERGVRGVTIDDAVQLAAGLGVHVADLVDGDELTTLHQSSERAADG